MTDPPVESSAQGMPADDKTPHTSRPILIPRGVLWHPIAGGATLADVATYPLFIEQKVLVALEGQIRTTLDGSVIGFLTGELCECPESAVRYTVVDSLVRLSEPVSGDRTKPARLSESPSTSTPWARPRPWPIR